MNTTFKLLLDKLIDSVEIITEPRHDYTIYYSVNIRYALIIRNRVIIQSFEFLSIHIRFGKQWKIMIQHDAEEINRICKQ